MVSLLVLVSVGHLTRFYLQISVKNNLLNIYNCPGNSYFSACVESHFAYVHGMLMREIVVFEKVPDE